MPFVDDYTKTNYVNENVQATGTPDVSAENLNNTENGVKRLFTALSNLFTSHEALDAQVDAIGASYVDTTFKTGLKLEWVSATQVRIKSGACYVPAASAVGEIASDVTITPSGLVANTFYYVYAIFAAGSLTFEASTTVPILYRGTAWHKTGDSSRRFVGSFRTGASAQIYCFERLPGGRVQYKENLTVAPFALLADAGARAAGTVMHFGNSNPTVTQRLVPPTSRAVVALVFTTSTLFFQTSDDPLTDSVNQGYQANGGSNVPHVLPLNASQQAIAGGGGGIYLYVVGYLEEL